MARRSTPGFRLRIELLGVDCSIDRFCMCGLWTRKQNVLQPLRMRKMYIEWAGNLISDSGHCVYACSSHRIIKPAATKNSLIAMVSFVVFMLCAIFAPIQLRHKHLIQQGTTYYYYIDHFANSCCYLPHLLYAGSINCQQCASLCSDVRLFYVAPHKASTWAHDRHATSYFEWVPMLLDLDVVYVLEDQNCV